MTCLYSITSNLLLNENKINIIIVCSYTTTFNELMIKPRDIYK
ncbi:MAG: hypothetical protein JWP45_2801 [Mucilaginibacter sp.]|nr:hypothetical protein [Mucilaginibacter sp.]